MTNRELFTEIFNFDFDEYYKVDPGMTFADKLMKANNWTELETKINIREYKKFMYLYIVHDRVAPSDPIDQVWHQHILYTRDYERFCLKFAGKFLHHAPSRTKGSADNTYELMLKDYEAEFGEKPNEVWALKPADYKRVDLSHNYLVPGDSIASAIKLLFIAIKNQRL